MLNKSAHSRTRCKKNIHVSEKARMITRQNAWFANQEPIYLSCTNTHLQSEKYRKAIGGLLHQRK